MLWKKSIRLCFAFERKCDQFLIGQSCLTIAEVDELYQNYAQMISESSLRILLLHLY